ncbi:MAG: NUDIX domain-containing protein [Rhodospirillaceae bacterium]|jgi:ADP-ribose pyrophosphatase|nr:NUDIX domain-containing protein [Rhodospirillaceae bacterium]MBT3493935.1 NUDIX domain-containing protein [Rhodospirillaceae bacterium]MBT3780804.1 NUDIX domain-containing protein [Rhodospirillaceae bacterium]MBT3976231.1 NUDIX domain-containing protein [Rhodospirillaceae bacterium]MBT4168974.1 NUDIX domain-containing protein [Rhodospirillaceae bacterium]
MSDPDRKVDVIEKTTVFQGYYRVDSYRLRHSLYRGGMGAEISREVLERGHAVLVLPYDPVRDEVVLIEQFRIGPFARGDQPWSLEVVAGIIEDGEELEDVVRREAMEEAGIELSHITHALDCYASPGAVTEQISIYCARTDASLAGGIHGVEAEGEDIKVIVMPFGEVMKALDDGRINAGPAIIAVQWLALHRDEIRLRWLD